MSNLEGILTFAIMAGLIIGYVGITLYFNRKHQNEVNQNKMEESLISVEEQ